MFLSVCLLCRLPPLARSLFSLPVLLSKYPLLFTMYPYIYVKVLHDEVARRWRRPVVYCLWLLAIIITVLVISAVLAAVDEAQTEAHWQSMVAKN